MAVKIKSHHFFVNLFISCLLVSITTEQSLSEGDPCNTESGKAGKCILSSQCENLGDLINTKESPISCGFGVFEEIICCPTTTTETDAEEYFNIPLKNILTSTQFKSTIMINRHINNDDSTVDQSALLTQLSDLFRPSKPERNLHAISKSGNLGNTNPFLHMPNTQTGSKETTNPWLTTFKSTTARTTLKRDKTTQTFQKLQQENMGRDNPIMYPTESDEEDPYIFSKNTLPTRRTTTKSPVTVRSRERAAVRACAEIDKGLEPVLTPHILGGTPVHLGEYPHMAALGFPVIGSGELVFRCGGTLIAPRFVLTAAHCFSREDGLPIVRLGFVNLNNEQELQLAVNMPVKQLHIHPEYRNSRVYNDIAILELEREVPYSRTIYPTCLYTEPEDPPAQYELYATGWGVTNATTRVVSKILLKAKLTARSLSKCNVTYVEERKRNLPYGLQSTQMCAYDPMGTKDSCQGDSGGPLNLVLDETVQKYRVVGITSAGFVCGTVAPSLYTRVSAYLDFIESIVWPNSDPN